MKKLLALVLCISMALVMFAGCSGEGTVVSPSSATVTPEPTETPSPTPTEPPLVLSMASAGTLSETYKGDALKKGFTDLKELSSGALTIDFYEGGDKGTDADIIEAVKSGGVSIYTGDASMMQATVPQLALLDLPMMFPSLSACNTMLSGSFIEMMQPYFNEAGMQLIGAYSTSFNYLTSSVPIATATDLKGLIISTSENQYDQLFWKTLGCNVFPLNSSQIYTALKQGMHKAQESTDAEINGLKLYDVQSTLVKTRNTQSVGLFVMNKAQYDALTEAQKGWFEKFITQAEQDEITAVATDEASQESTFNKKKLVVSEPTPEVLAALEAAVPPVVDLMKQSVDPALVDQYIAACRQAELDAANAAATPTVTPTATAPLSSSQPTT